jgi:hypothetical protein
MTLSPYWTLNTGDDDRILQVLIGGVEDLSFASTVEGVVTRRGVEATFPGTIVDSDARIVELDTTDWLDDTEAPPAAGTVWNLKVRFGPTVATWPEKGRATITIV